jgi:diaminopimelate decarboxylase
MLKFLDNAPYVEETSILDILKVCQTPFYLYSQEKIIQKVEMTKKILGNNIYFSVKSNSNQAVLKLMQSLGIGADVVSIGELKRSLAAGFSTDKIIFEGV